MGVKCLCWNCGREIAENEETFEVNEELWCKDCAAPTIGKPNNEYDENPV